MALRGIESVIWIGRVNENEREVGMREGRGRGKGRRSYLLVDIGALARSRPRMRNLRARPMFEYRIGRQPQVRGNAESEEVLRAGCEAGDEVRGRGVLVSAAYILVSVYTERERGGRTGDT